MPPSVGEARPKVWGRHYEHILYLRKTETIALNICGKDGNRAGFVWEIFTGLQSVI